MAFVWFIVLLELANNWHDHDLKAIEVIFTLAFYIALDKSCIYSKKSAARHFASLSDIGCEHFPLLS